MSNIIIIPTPEILAMGSSIIFEEAKSLNSFDPLENSNGILSGFNNSQFIIFGSNLQYAESLTFSDSTDEDRSVTYNSGHLGNLFDIVYSHLGFTDNSGNLFQTGEGTWPPLSGFVISGHYSGLLTNRYYRTSVQNRFGTSSPSFCCVQILDDPFAPKYEHLIPKSSGVYQIGSLEYPWKDIYLTTGSIYLGSQKIQVKDGHLQFDGNFVITGVSGSAGEIGSLGATGPAGAVGATGPAGAVGVTGPVGTPGIVVQTVYAERTTLYQTTDIIPSDNTIPQYNEGGEVMEAYITPLNSANYLYITAQGFASASATNSVISTIIKDGESDAIVAIENRIPLANDCHSFSLTRRISAGSTDAQRFSIRIGLSEAGTASVGGSSDAQKFGGVGITSLTIDEKTS